MAESSAAGVDCASTLTKQRAAETSRLSMTKGSVCTSLMKSLMTDLQVKAVFVASIVACFSFGMH